MKATHASVFNPNWRYAKSEDMSKDYLKKKFARIKRELAKAETASEYFRADELAEGRKPMPSPFIRSAKQDQQLMDEDYEQMGDPYHPFHLRSVG